jgi:hypothetical protein
MPASNSRYAQTPTQQATVGGRDVTYLRLRLLPAPAAMLEHRVAQGERLDHIAGHYLQESTLFWQICDANRAMLPGDLTAEPGQLIKIPFPQR